MKSESKKSGGYEVYDYKKPGKAGYPIYLGEDKNWHFGEKITLLMKGDPTLQLYENVSESLYQSIPHTHYQDINVHDCQPINSKGIVKFKNGENYLKTGDKYIRIIKKENSHNIFELGSEQSEKILCYFNKDKKTFHTLEEKETIVENDHREEDSIDLDKGAEDDIHVNKEIFYDELNIQFENQKKLTTYREGFRGTNFEDYMKINSVDNHANEILNEIFLYGLNEEEISHNFKYEIFSKGIKNTMTYSEEVIEQVKDILQSSEKESYVTEYMRTLHLTNNNGELSNYTKEMLINKIDKTNNIIKDHINDNCRRVWFVDHKKNSVYALTFIEDPLKRIYVNAKMSTPLIKEYSKGITTLSESSGISIILHETSHIGADTTDNFYLSSELTLKDKIEKLFSGEMSENEIDGIIKTNAAQKVEVYRPSEEDIDRAKRLFNDDPDVRGEFLLNNADSLTQIILDLHNGAIKMSKRDTQSQQGINVGMLYLLVSQGLSERKHGL